MQGVILFGTGDIGKKICRFLREYGILVKYWIDSNPEKQGKELYGFPIYSPSHLGRLTEDYVCISAKDTKCEIQECILAYGVHKDKILRYSDLMIYILERNLTAFQINSSWTQNRKKVILDCTSGLGLGGVEAWSVEMLEQMEIMGYDTYIIAPFGKYQVSENVRQKTIFVELDTESTFSRHNIENLYQVLQVYCPCIVISKSIDDLVFASCMIKKKNLNVIRLISVIHQGLDAVYKENAEISPYVDQYIAVSEDIRNGMIEFGIELDRIRNMTCPVQCSKKLCREYSVNGKGRIKLGYAGRLEKPQKRLDKLLQMLEVLERLQCNYELEIAGDGKFSGDICKFIRDRQLESRVKMLGKLERGEITNFWRRQDICINIADHEGRSISIMEAMANGAVPIVTMTSGVREDITDGENGYIVDIGDYETMADRIQYLSENRQLLKIMGGRAHEVISAKSDMNKHMEFWEQVLSEL